MEVEFVPIAAVQRYDGEIIVVWTCEEWAFELSLGLDPAGLVGIQVF